MTLLPLCAAALLITACGGGGGSSNGGGQGASELRARGKQVYMTHCAACHQPEGGGVPSIYPPLVQTEWVQGDEGRLIRLVLHGMRGPVSVKGVMYDQVMIPHNFLTDREIAAVLTYVRSAFGNEAGPVSSEQVEAVRASSTQKGFWRPDELEQRVGVPE